MLHSTRLDDVTACSAKQTALHERASAVAVESFGIKVFVRAVIEVFNFCCENCPYCGMLRDNRTPPRARARHDELAEFHRDGGRHEAVQSEVTLAI